MSVLHDSLPQSMTDLAGKIILVEATPGSARRNLLQQWLQDVREREEAFNWFLSCAFDEGGAWAGLQDLVQDLVPYLKQHAPELLSKHSYELCLTAPILKRSIQVHYLTLTDKAQEDEHVRNYPLDRAYRSLHGVIDLLDSWYELQEKRPVVIVCDQYDQACPLVQRFFMELMRRRGRKLQLTLVLAVAPEQGTLIVEQVAPEALSSIVQLELPADPPSDVPRESIVQEAQILEQQVKEDLIVADTSTPRLISLLERSGQIKEALLWKADAVHRFNLLGLYEASFRYCEEIDVHLDEIRQDAPKSYPRAVLSLYFCYLSLGNVERSLYLMTEKVLKYPNSQPFLFQCYYLQAMLYARFLPVRNLPEAVEYLERGQELLAETDLPETVRYFYIVFLNNGLAYIRAQQRRPDEAIALCSGGLQLLEQHLSPNQHWLHRSVLLYNIAQVYVATKQYEAAIETFELTMNMDPYYSEYYNERGSVYLAVGNLPKAEQDYLRAIELSPPYSEVWINLGQCYREMERVDEAIAAYTRALDLKPDVALALAARAEMYAEQGRWQEALADYSASLQSESGQPLVLAARAIAHYETGQVELAVADLDAAVLLLPDNPVFYQNRALALSDLGRFREAEQDLRTYLRLQPDAEDRDEVEQQLLQLCGEGAS